MSEATDPANQYLFVGQERPLVDFAEKARADAQEAYRKRWDTKERPLNQHGHIWRVSKKPTQ